MERINQEIDPDFWRWYLNNELSDFREVTRHDRVLNNCKNIFSKQNHHNLNIDLVAGVCTDSEGLEYPISNFIAKYQGISDQEAVDKIEVQFAKWEERQKERKKRMKFRRDEDHLRWRRKTGESSYEEVTDYDIVINAIVESYDLKVDEWNRKFECTLRYYNQNGKYLEKDIDLTPEETHTFNKFSNAVWDKATRITQNLKGGKMRQFWAELERYYEPRVVREFKYYGFIEFDEEKFYLAKNVLVKFPDHSQEPLEMVAKDEEAFQVKENKYIKPSDDPMQLPHFDLGVPQDGQFQSAMKRLYDDQMFEKKLKEEIIDEFCGMVGGDSEFRQWGKLLVGYIFSYIYFEDIYDHFNHVIFLYLFGRGNVGKGEVVKRILDFYGISYLDSLQTPKARNVDNALEEKSQIPLWVDEHIPEVPGKDPDIEDQYWNSWFELKMRRTSMPDGISWSGERKAVRTMPVFCSNYRPKSDHLLSRCLILEYKRSRRGPEKHVNNLKNKKTLMQRLMLSYMQKYKLLNREAFVWDMDRIRNKLKQDVKDELASRTGDTILQDRQISQFAALLTVYHWLFKDYRDDIEMIHQESIAAEKESDDSYRETLKEKVSLNLQDVIFDKQLYEFVKDQATKSAVTAAQHDPFSDFVETVSTLIESNDITPSHFNWMKDGTLKIWAQAVWDEYVDAKRGTNDIVRKEVIYDKFKELSELKDGGLKTMSWTPEGLNEAVNCKGFYIRNANENELLRMGFQLHNYGPLEARIDTDNKQGGEEENMPNDTTNDQEDLPF